MRVFGVRPYQPSARRVYQPAALYQQTKLHRVYVNPDAAIPAGASVEIAVPFYSELVADPPEPDPTQDGENYIDWWNGMRVYLYDDSYRRCTRTSEIGRYVNVGL